MRTLTQAQLNDWLNGLAKRYDVVAPVSVQGKIMYRQIKGSEPASSIAWGFERSDMSPKGWLFPETEPILVVEHGSEVTITDPPPPAPSTTRRCSRPSGCEVLPRSPHLRPRRRHNPPAVRAQELRASDQDG